MESQASGSGSAPKNKKPKLNFSHVHREFEKIEVFNARKEKNVPGSKCKHCGQSFYDRNSTNLKAHLKSQHPEIHKVIITLDEMALQKVIDSQGGSNSPSCSRSLAESLFTPPRHGSSGSTSSTSLDDSLTVATVSRKRKGKDDDWSKEKQEKSDKLLAFWIGGSTLPVSAVQDPNMLRYVKSLNPDATVPDRRKLTDGIATLCDKNIAMIREALSTARRVTITTDIWSSKLSADSFIGITAHFINTQERKRQWLKISCSKFNEAHTGPNIAAKLFSILHSYEIEDKVWYVLTDSGPNMVKGIRDLKSFHEERNKPGEESGDDETGDQSSEEEDLDLSDLEATMSSHSTAFLPYRYTRLPCAAHKVHLVVEKSASNKSLLFGETLKKARGFVVKYRKSSKAKEQLRQWFPKRIPGYVITRWWTDVQMLRVLLEAALRPDQPLKKLSFEISWDIVFTSEDIANIQVFVQLMDPMEKLFSSLNSEKESTIHLCYPTVLESLASLAAVVEDQSNAAHTFATKLEERMKSQFSYLLEPKDKNFQVIFWVATFLSPVYRVVLASDTDKMTEVKRFLEDLIPDNQDTSEDIPTEFVLPDLPLLSKKIFSGGNISGANCHRGEKLGKDLALYERKAAEFVAKMMAEAVSREETKLAVKDPLKFWLSQETSGEFWTELPRIAQDILAVPATSVPSERLFSISGILSEDKRCNISPENLERRVLLKANSYF